MDLVTLVTLLATAAGEAGHAADHDATPFYLVGGALAALGVIAGAVGIAKPAIGGAFTKAIIGVGAVLAAGTMVAIVAI
jgi:hypothetical protein